MKKEIISEREGIILVILFIMGSTLAVGAGKDAGNDAWLSVILGMVFAFPFILIYSRILTKFPGKDLFEILEITFGKFIGKLISLLYIWFSFHLGSLVIRNYGEFIRTVGIKNTPYIIPMGVLVLLCVWSVKDGIEVLGRWGKLILNFLLILIIFVSLLQIPNYRLDNLKPILYNGVKPVLKGGFAVFSFPMAETIIFSFIFSSLGKRASVTKVYTYGLLIGGMIVIGTVLHEVLALGGNTFVNSPFPSYMAIRRIDVGRIFTRIEIIVSTVIIMAGFIKISMCLLAVCKGITRLFNCKDYRFLVLPIGLLMLNTAYLLYDDLQDMREWAKNIGPYYKFPFFVIIPLIIFISVEIKTRDKKPGGVKSG